MTNPDSTRRAAGLAMMLLVSSMPGRMIAQQVTLAGPPIHQEADFAVAPAKVYQALVNQAQFRAFSGMAATLSAAVGGSFTIFGGHIVGRQLELVPGKRVVQAWRTVDWPVGIWSVVRFELEARGTGTHLVFDQTGFPEGERASLSAGWESHYWSLLKTYLH